MRYTAKLVIWKSVDETREFGFGMSKSIATGKAWKGELLIPPNVKILINGESPDDVRKRAREAAERMLRISFEEDVVEGTRTEEELKFTL